MASENKGSGAGKFALGALIGAAVGAVIEVGPRLLQHGGDELGLGGGEGDLVQHVPAHGSVASGDDDIGEDAVGAQLPDRVLGGL